MRDRGSVRQRLGVRLRLGIGFRVAERIRIAHRLIVGGSVGQSACDRLAVQFRRAGEQRIAERGCNFIANRTTDLEPLAQSGSECRAERVRECRGDRVAELRCPAFGQPDSERNVERGRNRESVGVRIAGGTDLGGREPIGFAGGYGFGFGVAGRNRIAVTGRKRICRSDSKRHSVAGRYRIAVAGRKRICRSDSKRHSVAGRELHGSARGKRFGLARRGWLRLSRPE